MNQLARKLNWLICCSCLAAACTSQAPKQEPLPATPQSSATPVVKPAPSKADTQQHEPREGTRFHFRDATRDWGLDFVRFDDMQGENRNQEAHGGGVAMLDYDLDGTLDLFFSQGGRLPRRKMTTEFTNELFWNRGGKLLKVTENAGLKAHGFFTGCVTADFDEDGYPDLYVSAFGRSAFFRNNGDGTFQNISESSGAMVDTWGTSTLFADLNGDGFLDLFIATYVNAHDDPPMICKEPRSPTGTTQCSPTLFSGLDDVFLVNDGAGGFLNATQAAGFTSPDGKSLGALACDFTGDGWMDIHVANDTTLSFLYVNETAIHDRQTIADTQIVLPRLRDCATEYGVATNGEGKVTAAMGIAHGDYDRDGWIDFFITNYYLEANTLFRNLQGHGFDDVSTASRLGPPSRTTLAFGTEFLDVDNDGWLDLLVTTGHVDDRDWTKTETYRMRPHLFRNERNGRFTDIASTAGTYFTSAWVGRGLGIGDLDRDGDLDAVMAQQIDPSVILLNETPAPSTSVVIKPVGAGRSPRSGIGTRVRAKGVSPILMRDIAGGGSFQSASAQELHFGLGDLPGFEQMECTWPDGQAETWTDIRPGYYVAIQGRGLIRVEVAAHYLE